MNRFDCLLNDITSQRVFHRITRAAEITSGGSGATLLDVTDGNSRYVVEKPCDIFADANRCNTCESAAEPLTVCPETVSTKERRNPNFVRVSSFASKNNSSSSRGHPLGPVRNPLEPVWRPFRLRGGRRSLGGPGQWRSGGSSTA